MKPIPTITWREFMLWLMHRRHRVRVTGNSMLPTLKPGDEVLIDPLAYRRHPIRPGDIVVIRHPFRADLHPIKRVNQVQADGSYDIRGDNPAESTDSRSFGNIPSHHVLGRVTCRFA